MSEYQRYEFMTAERQLTQAQLAAVNRLSSHIEASTSHALIEYHWGDFKHNPLDVLHRYFDGFLYWANWGAHRLGLRFPHGALPDDIFTDYRRSAYINVARHADYDLLDIQVGEMEPPDEWVEYELPPLMSLREELMDGDRRPLYITWLAEAYWRGGGDSDDFDRDELEEVAQAKSGAMPAAPVVPPGMAALTPAQRELARLLRLPPEYLRAAARYSPPAPRAAPDDFAAWLDALPPERQREYLLRLARNEPGLSRALVSELRALRPDAGMATAPDGPRAPFAALAVESHAMKAKMERERQEREAQKRRRHLEDVHEGQDAYWEIVNEGATRGSGAGYDQALKGLVELRAAAAAFNEMEQFAERFRAWFPPHAGRRALVKRLEDNEFALPGA